ncbi:hypothetical protein AVEN_230324-1 [Araneus ventricosus]|uniref:Uncharacterized protein n=1 Tax=Araneus ventricosus TaxID=182803 RepID=A0A4Y2SZG3_ARAVE|nr:hypothetical protein AVEN_230324-1 [Araneus ventricosus]
MARFDRPVQVRGKGDPSRKNSQETLSILPLPDSEKSLQCHLLAGVMPAQVPYHPFNYRMVAAIFIRMVTRHCELNMRFWMKPLTEPPGGKRRS